jgi:cleavage stimulation factor subunit 3
MEYHVNKDSAVAIRIFELGFKLFSEDVDYVVRYLQFLLNVNDDTSELYDAHLAWDSVNTVDGA